MLHEITCRFINVPTIQLEVNDNDRMNVLWTLLHEKISGDFKIMYKGQSLNKICGHCLSIPLIRELGLPEKAEFHIIMNMRAGPQIKHYVSDVFMREPYYIKHRLQSKCKTICRNCQKKYQLILANKINYFEIEGINRKIGYPLEKRSVLNNVYMISNNIRIDNMMNSNTPFIINSLNPFRFKSNFKIGSIVTLVINTKGIRAHNQYGMHKIQGSNIEYEFKVIPNKWTFKNRHLFRNGILNELIWLIITCKRKEWNLSKDLLNYII